MQLKIYVTTSTPDLRLANPRSCLIRASLGEGDPMIEILADAGRPLPV